MFMCLCCKYVYMHLYTYVDSCLCMDKHMFCGGPRLMLGIILNCFSTVFIEVEAQRKSQSSLIWLVLLIRFLWASCFHLPRMKLQVRPTVHSACTSVLEIQNLVPVLTYKTITTEQSPNPILIFLFAGESISFREISLMR